MKARDDLNEAIPLFLGVGVSPFPIQDGSRVRARFGDALGSQLEADIQKILAELQEIKPDWNIHDLNSATEFAVGKIHLKYPELSSEALAALDWCYSFGWK